MEKQKKLHYTKTLPKDKAKGSSTPYRFDVLAQLANISARITLYELLRLSKSIKESLREVLSNVEAILARIPAKPMEEDEEIAFTFLNMSPV